MFYVKVAVFNPLTPELKESGIRKYLLLAASQTNSGKLNSLLQVLLKLVNGNVLTPRYFSNLSLLNVKIIISPAIADMSVNKFYFVTN